MGWCSVGCNFGVISISCGRRVGWVRCEAERGKGKEGEGKGRECGGMGYTSGVISMYLWEARDGAAIARERWG